MPSPPSAPGASPPGPAPVETAILGYPGMTMLDVAGLKCVLGLTGRTHLVWKTLEPVMSDTGIP